MKRLSVLAMTAITAFVLTACGENVEKKVEEGATSMESTAPATTEMNAAPKETTPAAPAEDAGAKAGTEAAQPAAPQQDSAAPAEAAPAPQAAE